MWARMCSSYMFRFMAQVVEVRVRFEPDARRHLVGIQRHLEGLEKGNTGIQERS